MYSLKNNNKMYTHIPTTQLKKLGILETFEGPWLVTGNTRATASWKHRFS